MLFVSARTSRRQADGQRSAARLCREVCDGPFGNPCDPQISCEQVRISESSHLRPLRRGADKYVQTKRRRPTKCWSWTDFQEQPQSAADAEETTRRHSDPTFVVDNWRPGGFNHRRQRIGGLRDASRERGSGVTSLLFDSTSLTDCPDGLLNV